MELRARLAMGRKETLEEAEHRQSADSPAYPEVLNNALGEASVANGSPHLAVEAYEKVLTQ